MKTLILSYFAINIFLAGAYFENAFHNHNNDFKDKLIDLCIVILFFIAGLLIMFYHYIMLPVWKLLDELLQVEFWINYAFTKKYNEVDHKQLYGLNLAFIKRMPKKGIRYHIFRKSIELINKRNHFSMKDYADKFNSFKP